MYALVLVFFCCLGALRDWDLTSLGGGRFTFEDDLLLLDLLTLKEEDLLGPFEEPLDGPLEGPLEGVGAILSGFWIDILEKSTERRSVENK